MSLSLPESEALFGRMLDGGMTDGEIRDTLITLADRGETAEEIAGAAQAMRARMVRIAAPEGAIDVCGTGGDGSHSLNVSTAVALVVAACEVPVAKHGNRAASSRAGAADTLEALGLDLARAAAHAEATLADLGICFLFAQAHHPALKPIMPIRREIGRRTIFNFLGPLCNPAGVRRQLIGVSHPSLIATYAKAIALIGADDVMVVAGDEPMDELSVSGPSSMARVTGADRKTQIARVTPVGAGLAEHPREALRGGDAAYNAAALRRLLIGETETAQDCAYRDAVLFNSAAALMVAGHADDWQSGVEEAAEAIDKGLAKALLDCWIAWE
ncbi:MAG: anthranilate phosphoribosyltransferase [Sphingopyxis sp.]|nr:anthranilate phosphoribosyltransferase [Sphingopyxis sp.]